MAGVKPAAPPDLGQATALVDPKTGRPTAAFYQFLTAAVAWMQAAKAWIDAQP